MLFEELKQKYGTPVAARVRQELSHSEFTMITMDELPAYLAMFAELAHKQYQQRLDNPFINEELGAARDEYVKVLHQRWREAEDLAYLVSVADDVSANARLASAE